MPDDGSPTVIRHRLRLVAVSLAVLGQLAGAFGLPVTRGSAAAPDAACGCCPADRSAGRCCCHFDAIAPCCAPPVEDEAPCCQGKKATAPAVVWVIPTLRSKCLGPHDMVPESVVPASIPPDLRAAGAVPPARSDRVDPFDCHITSRSAPPDDPPPRIR